ncbi:MAG: PQQ-dependent sugar dehydrogenase [Verrucomicrobiales bacterium]
MIRWRCIAIYLALSGAILFSARADLQAQNRSRQPWETSRVKGSPEAPPPFHTEQAFPRLNFAAPIDLVSVPGSGRLMLAEHGGKIFTFPNRDDVSSADLFIDMKKVNPEVREVYSIAFHPGFATNRYIYIWYILKPELPDGTRIARFKMNDTEPPSLDAASEKTIITWKSGGHNGGSICFGKDGMLYISTGDGEGPSPPDIRNTGQDLSDLLSSVLRIDVDGEENGRAYRIPKDNPFIATPGARPEIWAYGLRNPWRMSVDPVSGDIWTADVGWELWEMVHKVERGANYGWSILEGSKQPVKPDNKRGPTPITPPVIEHPHSESSSITGGYVYRGKQYPELAGSYIYGDFDTGKIWELRYENNKVTKTREIASTSHKIVSFGQTGEGELLILDFRGSLFRLVPNKAAIANSHFPTSLKGTGIFAGLTPLTPAKGVVPFAIKAEMWSDYASAQRHIALPGFSSIGWADNKWQFPSNAVLVRTFSMEMDRGNTNSVRNIETQLLHFDGARWNPYTYKWNEEQTDAELVAAAGDEVKLRVKDSKAPGGLREQLWRFNSRAECMRCHNSWLNTTLAFTRQQLDRNHEFPGEAIGLSTNFNGNQLNLFRANQIIQAAALQGEAPAELVNPYRNSNESESFASLEKRARSYLHVNCSHCHRENAGGSTISFMNVELAMNRAGLIDKIPTQGNFGITDAKVVAPGDPLHSILYLRMAKSGAGRMPQIGSRLVDDEGLELVYQWIRQLKSTNQANKELELETTLEAGLDKFRKSGSSADIKVENPKSALQLARFLAREASPDSAAEIAGKISEKNANPVVRDLLERFTPSSQRREVIGAQVNPEKVLALKGDVERGRALFRNESLGLCNTCHLSENVGRDFGPDLSAIGKKYSRAQLLEHIVDPSKFIEPAYAGSSIELKDENSITGIIQLKSDYEMVIKDNSGAKIKLPMNNVQKITPMQSSIMPEGLLQSMTAQEVADLLDYLAAEK